MPKTARFILLFSFVFLVALIKEAMPRWWLESPQSQTKGHLVPVSHLRPVKPQEQPLPDFSKFTGPKMKFYLDSLLDPETRQAERDLDDFIRKNAP